MYGLAIRSTFPARVLISRMVLWGMAIVSRLLSCASVDDAGRRPAGPRPADLPDRLVHLVGHERLAPARDLGGVRVEDVLTEPPKDGIVWPGACLLVGGGPGDGGEGP